MNKNNKKIRKIKMMIWLKISLCKQEDTRSIFKKKMKDFRENKRKNKNKIKNENKYNVMKLQKMVSSIKKIRKFKKFKKYNVMMIEKKVSSRKKNKNKKCKNNVNTM